MKLIEDALVKQKEALEKQQQSIQQGIADLNAIQGARQELAFLIAELNREKQEAAANYVPDVNILDGEVA